MLVGAIAGEHEVRVAVDQPRRDPCAAKRVDLLRAITGELGPFPDPDDLAVGYPNRAVLDHAETAALKRRDIAVDEQPVPHGGVALGEGECYGQSNGGLAQSQRSSVLSREQDGCRDARCTACRWVGHTGRMRPRARAAAANAQADRPL